MIVRGKMKCIKSKLSFWDMFLISLLIVVLLLRVFLFDPVQVKGSSMNPTLHNGERMIEIKYQQLNRFDIVTLDAPNETGQFYIKRIIGLPEEVISYEKGILYVNGKVYQEPYLEKYTKQLTDDLPLTLNLEGDSTFTFKKIPKGKYLVLGDNRRDSKDGRYFGFIDKDAIHGKIAFKISN